MSGSAKLLVLACALMALSGCARLGYYAHLGKGGIGLVTRGSRVEKLLRDPNTSEGLKNRLDMASEMLDFADNQLGLGVKKQYRKYIDLERPYVVWTVVASPEFSLEPETWCFPIAGCVGYRGFFTPQRAERFAERLRQSGLEVSVGGVRAFSTLGWFGDPLLNTFLFDEESRLAGLLFHELAHGLVYVKGDTAFNESFATAVERAAVRRWLRAKEALGEETPSRAEELFLDQLARTDRAYDAVTEIRRELELLYRASTDGITPAEARRRKANLFARLQVDLETIDPERKTVLAGWIGRDLNNADLASVGFYRTWLASFESLLEAAGQDLGRFYSSAQCLAELPAAERHARLGNAQWGECILSGSWNSG